MTDWITRYTLNLDIRDQREGLHKQYIDACTYLSSLPAVQPAHLILDTRLADRAAQAHSNVSNTTGAIPSSATSPLPSTASPSADSASLRQLLATANAARTNQATALAAAQARISALESSGSSAAARVTQLTTRTRDIDEELREKRRLLAAVQDEVVGLTLERNLAEDKVGTLEGEVASLRGENEELVRRYLERVGVEAEAAGIHGRGKE